jgi:hypothetical protein
MAAGTLFMGGSATRVPTRMKNNQNDFVLPGFEAFTPCVAMWKKISFLLVIPQLRHLTSLARLSIAAKIRLTEGSETLIFFPAPLSGNLAREMLDYE